MSNLLNVKIQRISNVGSEWEQLMGFVYAIKKGSNNYLYKQVAAQVALLEYQIAVYGIFVEQLLNSRWRLTRSNVDSEKIILQTIYTFFSSWNIQNRFDH